MNPQRYTLSIHTKLFHLELLFISLFLLLLMGSGPFICPTVNSDSITFSFSAAPGQEYRIQAFKRDTLPLIREMIDEWDKVVPVHKTNLRFYFSAGGNITHADNVIEYDQEALKKSLFGDDYRQIAKDFMDELDIMSRTTDAWADFLSRLDCAFPGLGHHRDFRAYLSSFPEISAYLPDDLLESWTKTYLSRLLDENTTASELSRAFFGFSSATAYAVNNKRDCGLIAFYEEDLGEEGVRGTEENISVALHETGHWVDHSTRKHHRYVGSVLGESLADIISHLYLADPCVVTNSAGDAGNQICTRNLADQPKTMPQDYTKPDDFAQIIRFASWSYAGGSMVNRNKLRDLLRIRDDIIADRSNSPVLLLHKLDITSESELITLKQENDQVEMEILEAYLMQLSIQK